MLRPARRTFFTGLALLLLVPAARAQDAAATAFIQNFGNKLIAIVDGAGSPAQKTPQLRPLIDQAVDVDGIARFCLGRFAAQATPDQMRAYVQLFHAVLVNNITAKIGEYQGVTFRMTTTSPQGGDVAVGTVIQRPNNAPVNVRWIVSTVSGAPKIVDVFAEGTSLRLTQRSDYASFLTRNGNSVPRLIDAMRHQVGG